MQKCFTNGLCDRISWISTAEDDVQGRMARGVPINIRIINYTDPQKKVGAGGQ